MDFHLESKKKKKEKKKNKNKKKNASFRFQTDDWTIPNTVLLKDTVVMSGFPHSLSADELKEKLPERFQKAIDSVSTLCLSICL